MVLLPRMQGTPAIFRRVNLVSKLKDGFGPKDKVRYFIERAAG